MRKITLFFAALLISMTAFAVNITDGTKLYLKPNANWNADGARFAAYFFNGDGELWVSMTDTDNDGVYEVTCSGTRGNVIFCRMNGGNSTNGWGNKWNQTADLTWDGTKNQYNVPDGAWDNSGNDYWVEFGNNTEIEVPTTWTIAGNVPCLGAEWATEKTENDLVEGENGVWTKTYAGVTLEAGTYEYKIAKNHMWGEAYPSQNATLEIAADGKYDVTFTFDANAKTVNATAEKLCVKASWSFDGITVAESGNLVLEKFTNVIVAFSGIDSVGREVTKVYHQGSSTNILFYEVLADGSLIPVEGNGLMYAKSSNKTITYSLQAKNYKAVEEGTYNYLKQGNYRIVIDGDAGVAGTGDILFQPNRTGLPKVYNEEVFTFDFKIVNDYVARYAQSANFEATPAYERYAAPTLLESLSEIIVKFTDYESITVNATYGDNQTYIPCVVSENGANVEKAQVKWEAVEGTPNALRLYIDEAVTATGTYGITIPEGLVTFKKTAAEEAYNEAIALSYTVAQKNITEGLKLYYDFSAVESLKALTYANAVLNNGEQEVTVELANISEGLWELTVPAGTYFHATINLGTSAGGLSFGAAFLYYDGTNNLYTLKADAPYVQWGMAELGDFTLSVYPTEPEVVPTIVGGTKLYLKSDLGVSSSSAYGYNVVFGEFEVPSSGGSGGGVRPMQQAGSLGGTTTIPGTAMTKVYTKEGKYDIWEVVAPEGTADSIFNIVVSRKGTMISGYITPLKYDGEHNMFMLPENFAFDLRTPVADETAGEWGIYVEGEYSDPDPIVGTWNIEEGAVLESFESATITFTGVESAAAKSSYTNYFFYKVAEDGTETLVPSMCSDGYMDAAAEGTSVTFSIDVEGCYFDMPQYGAYFALTSGDYRIKVPAGAIKFNGDATNLNTEAYVLNFTLNVPAAAEPVEAVYTVDPENNSTVAEIREIVLTFTEYETITVAEPDLMTGSNIPTVSMGYEGMFMPSGMFMMFAAGETANTLKLYVDPRYAGGMEAFTTEGEYKIVIPEGVVTFGEAGLNKTIELNYTVEAPLAMEVEFANIAAIYEMGMWDMSYYESYEDGSVKAILKSQPTVVDKVVSVGRMGGASNNYYLNDGTGVIVLQAPATSEIYGEVIEGLEIEVGQKLPADFTATIDFKCVVDEETWLPTGEVYGAPVMSFVSKVIGVDEEGWIIEEPYADFVARCEASDFVEEAVVANIDDVFANRMNYAGKLLTLNAEGNYYAALNQYSATMESYMYWDAEEAFDVETLEEEGTTYVFVSPKYTEDWNNYAGKLFNVQGEGLVEAAFDANATIDVVTARFDWNSIAVGQTFLAKEYEVKTAGEGPEVDVENSELVVNVYSNNGSVYVETEAGVMIEVYTVNGLRVYAGVSTTNTTVINGLNTNIAIIRVNGVAYKVFVK